VSDGEQAARAARLRRLRAALGASADALLSRGGIDAPALIAEEVAFVGLVAPGALAELWRELRTRALALAADLEPTDQSVALLEERLAADEARLARAAREG
jgi:hypothetical protein